MITIYKNDNIKITKEGEIISAELRGLSTDTKPSTIEGKTINNGSVFIEIDTGKIFFFDGTSKTWKEV